MDPFSGIVNVIREQGTVHNTAPVQLATMTGGKNMQYWRFVNFCRGFIYSRSPPVFSLHKCKCAGKSSG